MNVLKIATLNINGIHTPTRISMLNARYHDLGILFLQEDTHPDLGDLLGYVTYTNVGMMKRWTAFVTRSELQVADITKLPSGRGIAAGWVGNVYAPSETAKRRENFSSTLTLYTCCAMPLTTCSLAALV